MSRDLSAWCRLYDASGQELARDGLVAARILLTYQTPVGMIPPLSASDLLAVEADPPISVTDRRPAL